MNATEKRIRTSYTIVTEESAAEGDFAETGWVDEEGEAWDSEYDESPTYWAAEWLENSGVIEASSSQYRDGVWYLGENEQDYSAGEYEQRSYHLVGFSADEEEEIYDILKTRRVI